MARHGRAIIGMCICNDRRWPETYRVMGLQGVEIVVLGYNTPIENIHHDEPAASADVPPPRRRCRPDAYQNGTWVVGRGQVPARRTGSA